MYRNKKYYQAIKDRPQKFLWAGLALLRLARPLLRRYAQIEMDHDRNRITRAWNIKVIILAAIQCGRG